MILALFSLQVKTAVSKTGKMTLRELTMDDIICLGWTYSPTEYFEKIIEIATILRSCGCVLKWRTGRYTSFGWSCVEAPKVTLAAD